MSDGYYDLTGHTEYASPNTVPPWVRSLSELADLVEATRDSILGQQPDPDAEVTE